MDFSKADSRNDGKTPSPNGCRLRSPPVASLLGSTGRTSAFVPFPDLNFPPDSQPAASFSTDASTSLSRINHGVLEVAGPSLAKNLEAEVEPVDDHKTKNPSGSVSVNGVSPDSDHTPPPPPPPPPSSSSTTAHFSVECNRIAENLTSSFASKRSKGYGKFRKSSSNSRLIAAAPYDRNHQSLAVPPPPGFGDNRVSTYVASPAPTPRFQRSNELVRFGALEREQQKLCRDTVRRTRMIYNSLQIHHIAKAMKDAEPGTKPRVYVKVSNQMKERGLWLNQGKHIVGSVPGVEIGDIFSYRLEMCMVGLHGVKQAGIDFLTAQMSPSGEPIATSIVVSGGYEDDEDRGDVLIYTGHGGQKRPHGHCEHQMLEGGNLAMERSMRYGIEIRVIRGSKYENSISSKVYVYDGLYKIVGYEYDFGKSGFKVFKFTLVRIEGQPEMGSMKMKLAEILRDKPLKVRPDGYLSFDLSCKKENVPVYLYNDIDTDRGPIYYQYLSKATLHPLAIAQSGINMTGCDCTNHCTGDCPCAKKNGGEFAYDHKGNLLRGKPVIFECGGSCKCGPSCKSRVTQKGMKKKLEVFKSREMGWAVRTLGIINAGEFICEYAGVTLTRDQAFAFSMNGEEDSLVHPGRFPESWRKWGDISLAEPEYAQPNDPSLPPLYFAMDVAMHRNVASYITHSREPNVMAQFVLHDHDNLMFPRVMLFALETISPLTMLSLDYGFGR